MTERPSVHLDVAAYALGTLSPEERVSFERHLSSCVRCRAELQELRGVVVLGAAVAPAHESPPGLEARTFAAIERAAVEGPSAVEERSAVGGDRAHPGSSRAPWWRILLPRVALAGGLAAVIVLSVLAGTRIAGGRLVVPGDRPGAPNRISAGTFHPDPEGRSRVIFHAAVNPRNYPGLAVTREPGDGDPDPTGVDIMRGGGRG